VITSQSDNPGEAYSFTAACSESRGEVSRGWNIFRTGKRTNTLMNTASSKALDWLMSLPRTNATPCEHHAAFPPLNGETCD